MNHNLFVLHKNFTTCDLFLAEKNTMNHNRHIRDQHNLQYLQKLYKP